jgi:hypothetical protein
MSRISPASAERLAELAPDFEKARKQRGYVPNSWLTLARKPRSSGWCANFGMPSWRIPAKFHRHCGS